MSVFADTSALYALLVRTEDEHRAAVDTFRQLVDGGREIVTTSYVLVETVALLQHGFGVEAVRDLHERLLPLVRMHGVTEALHRRAMTSLLRSDRGRVSFVDHVSFGFMMGAGIRTAFTLDRHFAEAGFEVLPA